MQVMKGLVIRTCPKIIDIGIPYCLSRNVIICTADTDRLLYSFGYCFWEVPRCLFCSGVVCVFDPRFNKNLGECVGCLASCAC